MFFFTIIVYHPGTLNAAILKSEKLDAYPCTSLSLTTTPITTEKEKKHHTTHTLAAFQNDKDQANN